MSSTDSADIVVNLIALNDGTLAGRTRLQKQAYLLKRCGIGFDIQFTYHRYGPYSFDLSEGLDDAIDDERVTFEEDLGRYEVPYAIFQLKNRSSDPAACPDYFGRSAKQLIQKITKVSGIILELAATIVFLRDEWDYFDKGNVTAIQETRRRKSRKATKENLKEAVELLRSLDLDQNIGTVD